MDETHGVGIHLEDRPLELLEQEGRELLFRLFRRAVVAVRVAHVPHLGDERLERGAQCLDAVDGQGPEGRAVVRDVARDRLVLPALRWAADLPADHLPGLDTWHLGSSGAYLEILARELPRRLDRFRAARDEENAVEVAGGERRDLRGELDRTRMRIGPVRIERQLAHLLERRVAEVDREEPRERVEIALAVDVLEVAAVAAHDDRRLLRGHVREVEPEVLARQAPEILGGRRVLRDAHFVGSSFGIPLPQS